MSLFCQTHYVISHPENFIICVLERTIYGIAVLEQFWEQFGVALGDNIETEHSV